MDGKHNLLVVDNEKDITDQLYDYLRKDYNVYKAYDCQDALGILKDNEVDLVVAEEHMPNMQGTEFLAKLREEMPEITRILMTGFTNLEAAVDAINNGSIHRYLTKPLNFEDVDELIKEGIQQYEKAAEIKNIVKREKEDIIGKLNNVFSHIKTIEIDKGKIENELQAAKEVEDRIHNEMKLKIETLQKERISEKNNIIELKEKLNKMMEDLELTHKEANKAKQLADENMKLKTKIKEIEAKFTVVNKSSQILKADLAKLKQELNNANVEKNCIEKKLKQFQRNWGKAMKA